MAYHSTNPNILKESFNLSVEFDMILHRAFSINPKERYTLNELRDLVLSCREFTVSSGKVDDGAPVPGGLRRESQKQTPNNENRNENASMQHSKVWRSFSEEIPQFVPQRVLLQCT